MQTNAVRLKTNEDKPTNQESMTLGELREKHQMQTPEMLECVGRELYNRPWVLLTTEEANRVKKITNKIYMAGVLDGADSLAYQCTYAKIQAPNFEFAAKGVIAFFEGDISDVT